MDQRFKNRVESDLIGLLSSAIVELYKDLPNGKENYGENGKIGEIKLRGSSVYGYSTVSIRLHENSGRTLSLAVLYPEKRTYHYGFGGKGLLRDTRIVMNKLGFSKE